MSRIIRPSLLTNWCLLIVLSIFILSFHGCAGLKIIREKPPSFPVYPEDYLKRNDFAVSKEDDVIGQLAIIRLEEGDTLPDIARHFSLGINEISAANPGVDVWVPDAGERIMLPLSFILPDASKKGIVINLAAMRLFQFKEESKSLIVSTYPIGIGTEERPSPIGQMYITRKATRPTWYVPASIAEDHRKKGDPLPAKVLPGSENPLGEYALYLSKSTYLIHGTNKPASIGLKATNGCIRLYPEHIKRLYADTPAKTPVSIVSQPYLVGQRNGVVYLEVHAPTEGSAALDLEKVYSKLRNIEMESGRAMDWKKVKEVLAETRGIPVPISKARQGVETGIPQIVEIKHPEKLYGKLEVPELNLDAWYVLAANMNDRVDAARLAAIISHQGPPIPAMVLSVSDRHRVMAGPFNDISEAKKAIKRLKIDLEIDGILVEPARKQ